MKSAKQQRTFFFLMRYALEYIFPDFFNP